MAESKGTHTAQQEAEPTKRPPWWKRLWEWTEFGKKSGWNWLELLSALAIPIVLAAAGFYFQAQLDTRQRQIEGQRASQAQRIENQRAEAERELAEQRAQDEALQGFLDQMSSLLLEKDLRASGEASEVRTLARARTLTVLRRLDPSRKTAVMQFLVEAELVQRVEGGREPIIGLRDADLSDTNLRDVDLSGANLGGANLRNATLGDADLSGTNLSGANLRNAGLIGTNLSGANLGGYADLSGASLVAADLRNATLGYADLSGDDLRGADLSGANLSNAYLNGANLGGYAYLSGANLSDANLSDANLEDVDLSGAYLSGADLGFAFLSGARGITVEELHQQAHLSRATTLPNGQKYADWLLPAGNFDTYKFEPAFHLEVGADWGEWAPETTDQVWLGPKGGSLIFTNPLHVFDPSNLSEPKELPEPENAAEWVSWFERHPNLDTSKPVPVSVGGASGLQIDVTATSTPENYPRDVCEQPCVPLYKGSTSETTILSYEGWKDRFVIADVGGETVLIDVAAQEDKFDAFSPNAHKVLDSVEWKGG